VRKVNGDIYLNRAEAIDYLIAAYSLRWCITKWSSKGIRISWQEAGGGLKTRVVQAYKLKKSKVVRMKKKDLDVVFNS
jgi:hypothetical protein